MWKLWAVTRETLLLLRRDKIFMPAAVIGSIIVAIAILASDWGIEEFAKILFDVGAAGYHLTGVAVAMLWGTKAVTDSRAEGSLEVQLASPISRPVWLIGKFFGLALALLLLAVILLVVLQILMLWKNFGWMSEKHLLVFGLLTLNWLVVAGVAIFFASFSSANVALFCTLCLWLGGLVTNAVTRSISPKTPEYMRWLIEKLAMVWDLQRFNMSYLGDYEYVMPPPDQIWWRVGYGLALVLFAVSAGCAIFNRRDLVG